MLGYSFDIIVVAIYEFQHVSLKCWDEAMIVCSSTMTMKVQYLCFKIILQWPIPFNSCTPDMDDQKGKFNPWTR